MDDADSGDSPNSPCGGGILSGELLDFIAEAAAEKRLPNDDSSASADPGRRGASELSHTLVPEPGADKMAKTFPNQTAWLDAMKSGCWGCHQIGNKATRELPAALGTFKTSTAAWERALSAGQDGRTMLGALNATGHDQTLAMYADWSISNTRNEEIRLT